MLSRTATQLGRSAKLICTRPTTHAPTVIRRTLATSAAEYTKRLDKSATVSVLSACVAVGSAIYISRSNRRHEHLQEASKERKEHTGSQKLVATPTNSSANTSANASAKQRPTIEDDFPPLEELGEHPAMRDRMTRFVKSLQRRIVTELSTLDGTPFQIDSWVRPEGGEGISCVLQDGRIFEKAGVNVSVVHGSLPEAGVRQMRTDHTELDPAKAPYPFFAAGISIVLHPHNPKAPTIHANYRYFEADPGEGQPPVWWFGGGCDLTPSILFPEDAVHFHQTLKNVCERHRPGSYARYKKWCDDYFDVKHRKERRGVGGIFFDDLNDPSPEEVFKFVQDAGRCFLASYLPILTRRIHEPFTDEQKRWQQIRRGRYVEFNLVHDRGTRFGLVTPGPRIESILMSLPLTARWEYQHQPEPDSEEANLLEVLRVPRDWIPLE